MPYHLSHLCFSLTRLSQFTVVFMLSVQKRCPAYDKTECLIFDCLLRLFRCSPTVMRQSLIRSCPRSCCYGEWWFKTLQLDCRQANHQHIQPLQKNMDILPRTFILQKPKKHFISHMLYRWLDFRIFLAFINHFYKGKKLQSPWENWMWRP